MKYPRTNLRFLAVLLTLCTTRAAFATDFVHDVMPILKQHCGECHTGKRKEGGLTLNSREGLLAGGESGAAVVIGDPAKSELIARITTKDTDLQMPPEGARVTAKEIAILNQWIKGGAAWEPGITLGESAWEPPLQPRQVTLPPAVNGRIHPVDRLLDSYLAERKKQTPPKSSDAEFLRRAYLDVHGLLPPPELLKEFLEDKGSDKRDRLIDKLLADDVAYADHWLTTWNDLLRNDYTGTGFITGGRKQITTWLYASLKENKPYDQFVRELISPAPEAAGFINGIKWRGEVNASQTRDIQFAQNISQVFLGINMKCASCHDSFIDRWTLSEAYNLAAIFADKTLELNRCDKPTGKMATPKWIFPEIGDVDPKAPKDVRLQQLSQLMTHPENGRFTRTVVNRLWHRLMGRGIVHPVDAMHTKPWNENLLDYLAVRFAQDGYDLRQFIRLVMTSEAYQAKSVISKTETVEDYVYSGPLAKRLTAEQLIDSIWQITGTNPAKSNASADRSPSRSKPAGSVAKSPAKAANAIVAKWIWHAGSTGTKTEIRKSLQLKTKPESAVVVATCDNAFVMKVNGKVVATSKDWQQPLRFDIAPHLKVGDNQIQVSGEMFGGAAGFISQMILKDAASQIVIATDKNWEARSPGGTWQAAAELFAYKSGPWGEVLANARRPDSPTNAGTAYPVRAALVINDFLMRSLGRPHRDQVVTTRPSELTTLQAIDLSNGDILAGYLSKGARNLVAKGRNTDELISWLFEFALSRAPTRGERDVLVEIAGEGRDPVAVEDLLWTVFMLPEFQVVR